MKTSKKILSLVLAVIMIVCTVPMAFAQGNKYEVGDIIEFGSYPQSEVKDEALIAELNTLAPEWENWTSYDYYWRIDGVDNGNLTMAHDWMKYTDVEYAGNKYRGVKFIEYRPELTISTSRFSNQDENGYLVNMTYWFKFEPVEWRVLDPETGYVMSEMLLDSQPFSNTMYDDGKGTIFSYFSDQYYKNYANDYETSYIRKWLNEDFFDTAFTNSEKKEISTTTLNNDSKDAVFDEVYSYRNETNDKIFLLSHEDEKNKDYGFINKVNLTAKGSDYAKCQGLYVCNIPNSSYDGTSDWILRTPADGSGTVYYVSRNQSVSEWVQYTSNGIRPAFKFNDINNFGCKHDYKIKVYAPTCTDKGFTTYTCECGDSYVADYTAMLGHKDSDGDYMCDYGCGVEFIRPEPIPEREISFLDRIIDIFKFLFNTLFGWMKR